MIPQLVLALVLAVVSAADEVTLKDGKRLTGRIVVDDARQVVIETPAGRVRVERSKVAKVTRDAKEPASPATKPAPKPKPKTDAADEKALERLRPLAQGKQKFLALSTERFRVLTDLDDPTFVAKVLAAAENAQTFAQELFGPLDLPPSSKADLYLFADRDLYARYVDLHAAATPGTSPAWAQVARKAQGFHLHAPPTSVSVNVQGEREALLGHAMHNLGHVLFHRVVHREAFLPPWIDEGFAATVERRVHGYNSVFCRVPGRYGKDAPDERLFQGGKWEEVLIEMVRDKRDPPLRTLITADVDELTLDMTLKAMGIVEILVDKRKEFRALYRDLRGRWSATARIPTDRSEATAIHEELLKTHLGWSLDQVDEKFRERFDG